MYQPTSKAIEALPKGLKREAFARLWKHCSGTNPLRDLSFNDAYNVAKYGFGNGTIRTFREFYNEHSSCGFVACWQVYANNK